MAMNQKEIKYWEDQLQFADRAWQEAGITSEPGSSSRRSPHTVEVSRYVQDYRGDQDEPLPGGTEAGDTFIGNLSFSLTNATLSMLSARDPEAILRPKGATLAEPDAWRRARINQALVQSQIREARFKREMDWALQSALTTQFGLVRHGYTPGIEEYVDEEGEVFHRFKDQKPDFPWIQFYRPWDVRIDPAVNSFDPDSEVRWVAFRDVYYEGALKKLASQSDDVKMPSGLKPNYELKPFSSYDPPTHMEDSPDVAKLYELWTFYDASNRTWFSLAPGTSKLVREETEWPLEWEQLPYTILSFNQQLDTPFGIPFPKLYAYEQHLYNKVWTMINHTVSRMRRIIILNQDALSNEMQQRIMNMEDVWEFVLASGNLGDVAKEIAFGMIDQQLVGLLFQLKESIRETLGISSFDRGQRVNVETAAEAQNIAAGASVQKSRTQTKFEEAWTEVVRVSHRALLQVQDERKFIIPVVGEENATYLKQEEVDSGFVEASVEDLAGEFDYSMKPNSTLPLDNTAEFSKAATFFQIGGGVQSTVLDVINNLNQMADLAGLDPSKLVISKEVAMQEAKQQDEQGSSNEAQGGGAPPFLAAMKGGQ